MITVVPGGVMVVVVGLLVPVMLLAVIFGLSFYEDLLFPPPGPRSEAEAPDLDGPGV
ncbi:hypothetical protein [Streptomyces sp. NPDC058964]|uniref:hypothetical protein n=1 Tax=Streptomyces sp. NPDC058964 TaxID=3346681 RepID=UPI003680FAFC